MHGATCVYSSSPRLLKGKIQGCAVVPPNCWNSYAFSYTWRNLWFGWRGKHAKIFWFFPPCKRQERVMLITFGCWWLLTPYFLYCTIEGIVEYPWTTKYKMANEAGVTLISNLNAKQEIIKTNIVPIVIVSI